MAQQRKVSYRKAVLVGLLAGALFGAVQVLWHGDVLLGVLMGAFFALVMTAVMWRVWGSTALRGLDSGQRRAASRALRRGEPVEDTRLARPLVDQAEAVLGTPHPVTAMRVAFVLMGVLGLVVAGLGLRAEGAVGLLGGAPLVLLALLMLFVVLPLARRQRERFRRSAEATRARHGLSSVDSPAASR